MPKDLNILILNSEALKLSIDDLTNEIDVPVKWDIVDLSDKDCLLYTSPSPRD